jgi:hypothetical protein
MLYYMYVYVLAPAAPDAGRATTSARRRHGHGHGATPRACPVCAAICVRAQRAELSRTAPQRVATSPHDPIPYAV